MSSLKSTTAMVLGMALAIQGPAFAQGQGNGQGRESAPGQVRQLAETLEVDLCDDTAGTPCLTGESLLLVAPEALADEVAPCSEGRLPCVTAAGLVAVEPGTPEAETALAASIALNVEQPTESAEAASPETEAQSLSEDAAADVETPAEEAVDQAVAANDPVEQDTAAEPDTGNDIEVASETAGQGDTAEDIEVVEAPADNAEGTTIEEDTSAEVVDAPESAPSDSSRSEVAEVAAETEAAEPVVEEAPAAAASATDDEAEADVDVATEQVTEETSRSASEEFATTASGAASSETSENDDGLSKFEKALILGLGAVAVGSILDNGDEVVSNSGDRVVLRDESTGNLRVLKDDDALLRQPGAEIRTETFNDGSTRTTVLRQDGTRIVTIRAADGRVVRRVRQFENGERVVLFDDTEEAAPVDLAQLPEGESRAIDVDIRDEDALRQALAKAEARDLNRSFSLRQIRQIREVRELAPQIELDAITFATGSSAIQPSQAEELAALGRAIQTIIEERPGEVFLIEGHTDAVGDASYNLALSDRRAETVALALSEYFDVPPENLITQGYGESQLRIQTDSAERLNRRATVRRITPLLRQARLD